MRRKKQNPNNINIFRFNLKYENNIDDFYKNINTKIENSIEQKDCVVVIYRDISINPNIPKNRLNDVVLLHYMSIDDVYNTILMLGISNVKNVDVYIINDEDAIKSETF